MGRHAKPPTAKKGAPKAAPPSPRARAPARPAPSVFQTKLKIGEPNDQYEQEANRVADHVLRMPTHRVQPRRDDTGSTGTVQRSDAPRPDEEMAQTLQRQADEEETAQTLQRQEDEEETAQTLQRQEDEEEMAQTLQRREEEEETAQTLQRQEDEEEMAQTLQRQADEEEMAQTLQRQEDEEEMAQTLQRQEEEEETAQTLQRQEDEEEMAQTLQRQEEDEEEMAQTLQRQEDEEEMAQTLQRQEEEEEMAQTLQRQEEEEEALAQTRARRGKAPTVTRRFERELAALRQSGGAPMPGETRRFLEPRFGQSFGDVRIHTGAPADRLTEAAGARAFTVGRDIVFASGEFRPGTGEGRRLIAHELTHVMQQQGGLHLVQREIGPVQAPATAAGRERVRLEELERRFALAANDGPPAAIAVARGLIGRALLSGPHGDALAVFRSGELPAATTRRVVEGEDYRLILEGFAGAQLTTRWTLERRTPEARIHAAERIVPLGEAHPAPLQDEDTLTLSLRTPPPFADDPAVTPTEPTPTEDGTIPDSDRAANGPPLPHAADPPSDTPPAPIDTAALDGPEVDKGAATSPPASDAGAQAGQDDPAEARPPVDQPPTDAVPEEEEEPQDAVQRLGRGAEGGAAVLGRGPARQLAALKGGGAPLPASLARRLGPAIGIPLGTVRIHHDGRAGRLASALHARAFTHGEDIVVAPDAYAPQTPEGLGLIAHELTHVRQQRQARGLERIQRQHDNCPPPDPVPEIAVVPSPAGPDQDPAFGAMDNRAKNRADDQARHGEGAEKSNEANAAAEVKEGENRLHGQSGQVGEMATKAQAPPAFDKETFIQNVLDEVARIAPDTMDAFLKFARNKKPTAVKTAVTGEVGKAREGATQPLDEASSATPEGQSPRAAGTLTPEPAGAPPQTIRADRAMPPMRTASEIDMSADTTRTQNILKEACITRDYMDEHDDKVLKDGASAQDEVDASAQASPQAFREEEGGILAGARSDASNAGQSGLGDLAAARAGDFEDVAKTQGTAKTDNEKKRDQISSEIDTIFTTTQTKVTTRLGKIDTDVATTFDTGADAAVAKFERDMDREAAKHEKSWLDTLGDWLFGPPPEEQQDFYDAGRRVFIADMRTVISDVADIVETGLKDAKTFVEEGKTEVKTKVDSLDGDLADFAREKAGEIDDKFRALEKSIDEKGRALVKDIAKRYLSALEKAKAAEDRIREAHKNILEKAEDVYNQVKDFVTGWIEKLAAIVGGAATKIIREPAKFLRNLGAGIVQGLQMFIGDIGKNIKGAVISWLTGNLSSGGIDPPTSFDAKGIIGFVLDLVGLGVAGIKKIATDVFGRTVVAAIEKGVEGAEKIAEIFNILVNEGPGGLFRYMQAEFVRMRDEALEQIGKALAESLVIAGIKKVLGIISGLVSGGVGTVVTIVATIIDLVLWFRDNAQQIAELVSTIAGAAMAVLNGQVAVLAGAVNSLLKRILPLVLGFVGALIGIGGVVRKIKSVFLAIGRPARKAIRSLFMKMKKFVSKILKNLKKKKKGGGKKDGKLSPKVVKSKVIAELKKPSKEKDPAKALAEVQARAETLKRTYQPKLERGRIKITFLDRSVKGLTEDGDVDLDVALSPGTKVAVPFESTLVERFIADIDASHATTKDDIRKSVAAISSKQQMIQNWTTVQSEIADLPPAAKFIGKPAYFSHRFGQAMQAPITAGAKAADATLGDRDFKTIRDHINTGSGPYAPPKQSLVKQIYTNSSLEGEITSAVQKAVTDAAQNTGKGADFVIQEPPILGDTSVTIYKRRAARAQFDTKIAALQAAARAGTLRYTPNTDTIRTAALQAKFRAAMKAKSLDISPFTWDEVEADHTIDLVVGGATDGELTMISESVNSSVGAQLKTQAGKHGLKGGEPIRSITVV